MYRTLRGGAWYCFTFSCRFAYRFWNNTIYRFNSDGFRVILVRKTNEHMNNFILRGGSWGGRATYCRSADRLRYVPDNRGNYGGFRVVLVRYNG